MKNLPSLAALAEWSAIMFNETDDNFNNESRENKLDTKMLQNLSSTKVNEIMAWIFSTRKSFDADIPDAHTLYWGNKEKFLLDMFDYGSRTTQNDGEINSWMQLMWSLLARLFPIYISKSPNEFFRFFKKVLKQYPSWIPLMRINIIFWISRFIKLFTHISEYHSIEDFAAHQILFNELFNELSYSSAKYPEEFKNTLVEHNNIIKQERQKYAFLHFLEKYSESWRGWCIWNQDVLSHFKLLNSLLRDNDPSIKWVLRTCIPLYQIASDRAIQLDWNNFAPQYMYCLEEWKLWERKPHEELFNDYEFESSIWGDYKMLIQIFHRLDILYEIETTLWIQFSDYPFSIQPPFLQFLAYATLEDFARVREFLAHGTTSDEKYHRLRVFLATAEKPDAEEKKKPISEVILDLDTKLQVAKKGELSNKIFEKYDAIMRIIEQESSQIQEIFTKKNMMLSFSKKDYTKFLLHRINEVLLRSLEKEQDIEKIDVLFGEIQTDLIRFGAFFRITHPKETTDDIDSLLEHYKVHKKTIKGTDLMQWDKQYLSVIRGFYEKVYRDRSNFKEIMELIDTELQEDAQSNKVEFTIFYFWDVSNESLPLLTIKFTEKDEHTVYFGWFNADPLIQKTEFWGSILKSFLKKYEDKDILGSILKWGEGGLSKFYKGFGFTVAEEAQEIEILTPDNEVKKTGIWAYKIEKSGANTWWNLEKTAWNY